MIKVAIIDDQDLIREGLAMIVDSAPDMEVVLSGADGQDLIDAVVDRRPIDVALVDVRMPGVDGLEATRRVVGRAGAPAVLILTTFDEDEYVLGAIAAGASGFLLKRAKPEELVHGVRVVASGTSLVLPDLTRRLIADRQPATAVRGAAALPQLTAREVDVLRLVAAGLSNAEIAERLFLSAETVKTHLSRVLVKVGARDRTQAVIAAYESGFVSPSE